MDWLENLGFAVAGGLLGAILRPWAERVFPMPGRLKRVRRTVERAWADHDAWYSTKDRERVRELSRVDEDMNARGLFDSGIRTQARQEVTDKYVDELKQNQRETLRTIEDAFAELGPVERGWLRWRLRRRKLDPASIEAELLREDGWQSQA